MTAAWSSISVAGVASGTANITVSKPTGVVTGGLYIATCTSNTTSTTFTPPAGEGWQGPLGTATTGTQVYWRLTTGSEASTYLFVRSNTTGNGGVAINYYTAGTFDAVTPIADCGSAASTAVTTIVLPTVTSSQANTLLSQTIISTSITGNTWTPPGGVTSRSSGTASGTAEPYNNGDEVVGSGATGTRTWTHTGSIAMRGSIVAINPVSAVPATSNPPAGNENADGTSPGISGAVTQNPNAGASTENGTSPGISAPASLSIPSGGSNFSGTAPNVSAGVSASIVSGGSNYNGTSPGISGGVSASIVSGGSNFSGGTNVVSGAVIATVTSGASQFNGTAPNVGSAVTLGINSGEADYDGLPPTITAGGSAIVVPPSGASEFSGITGVSAGSTTGIISGASVFDGAPCNIAVGATIITVAGETDFNGLAPTIIVGSGATVAPTSANSNFDGAIPNIGVGATLQITSGSAVFDGIGLPSPVPIITPTIRTYTVPYENRSVVVDVDNRAYVVPFESRVVSADD